MSLTCARHLRLLQLVPCVNGRAEPSRLYRLGRVAPAREYLKPLRYASVELDSRRFPVEAEIGSDIELQIGTCSPGKRRIHAVLSGPLCRIIVVVRPEFDVKRNVLDYLPTEIHKIDIVRVSSVVHAVLKRVDLGIE